LRSSGSGPTNSESIFDVPGRLELIKKLEARMSKSEFWNNSERAKSVMRKTSSNKSVVESWEAVKSQVDDVEALFDLYDETPDEDVEKELRESLAGLEARIASMEFESLMGGEDDEKNALLAIHPGAGGIDAQDWAQMLMRMYIRWAEGRGFEVDILHCQAGDEAGLKSATLEIAGRYAFGYLKAENGVHRLVRISPFDASHRRHTSFGSVFVYAEMDEDIEVDMSESDLKVDTYKASGAGGQHVNKTESAVRITHLPTGIKVECQSERSQHRNRDNAMKILRAKLHAHFLEEERKKIEQIEKNKKEIAWGSQIRSYVLQPYTLVKDHRTGLDTGNADAVLDGDIDDFIEAYLRMDSVNGKGSDDEADI
jgi:peptide chain release factor 2